MSETPQEAAKTRRRWINVGEIVGILALAISAASYWDSHREREAEVAAKVAPASRGPSLVLTGAADAEGDRIDLRAAASDQVIQTQTIRFPAAVRADAVETTGHARIEAAWFESGVRAAANKAKGRHRIAVGIETVYVAGDATRTDRAVYDIGYTRRERFLRPDAVALEGISLVAAHVGTDLQQRVDARFARQAK